MSRAVKIARHYAKPEPQRGRTAHVVPPTEAPGVCCPTELLQLRKQVVVAVTMDWTVMCFNHNLKLLWEYNLQHDFPHHSSVREVQHSSPSVPECGLSHRLCVNSGQWRVSMDGFV
jgi:hypothetical protein